MKALQKQLVGDIEDIFWPLTTKQLLGIVLTALLVFFSAAGLLLRALDPTAGVLDIGVLSVLLFGLLAAVVMIYCCYWLQELLWQPFKIFRQDLFYHFNQLTSWQQCIIYFSAFFLLLFALLWALAIVL